MIYVPARGKGGIVSNDSIWVEIDPEGLQQMSVVSVDRKSGTAMAESTTHICQLAYIDETWVVRYKAMKEHVPLPERPVVEEDVVGEEVVEASEDGEISGTEPDGIGVPPGTMAPLVEDDLQPVELG